MHAFYMLFNVVADHMIRWPKPKRVIEGLCLQVDQAKRGCFLHEGNCWTFDTTTSSIKCGNHRQVAIISLWKRIQTLYQYNLTLQYIGTIIYVHNAITNKKWGSNNIIPYISNHIVIVHQHLKVDPQYLRITHLFIFNYRDPGDCIEGVGGVSKYFTSQVT